MLITMQLHSVCVLHTILTFSMVQHVALPTAYSIIATQFYLEACFEDYKRSSFEGCCPWVGEQPPAELCCSPGWTQL